MKKYVFYAFAIALISACSQKAEEEQQPQEETAAVTQEESFIDQEYFYNLENANEECALNSEVACAVETAVKCIINPGREVCETIGLPEFVFMEDEDLQRPTEQSFKITKLKPLEDGSLEVYTTGTCNGNMFGLCNGTIIYVLKSKDDTSWRVSDVYAVE